VKVFYSPISFSDAQFESSNNGDIWPIKYRQGTKSIKQIKLSILEEVDIYLACGHSLLE
jgi:hypothetical protein